MKTTGRAERFQSSLEGFDCHTACENEENSNIMTMNDPHNVLAIESSCHTGNGSTEDHVRWVQSATFAVCPIPAVPVDNVRTSLTVYVLLNSRRKPRSRHAEEGRSYIGKECRRWDIRNRSRDYVHKYTI